MEAAVASAELLSDDCGESSDFLAAFSAAFKPFTSITVTKSPACDAGRVLFWVLFVVSTSTERYIQTVYVIKISVLSWCSGTYYWFIYI